MHQNSAPPRHMAGPWASFTNTCPPTARLAQSRKPCPQFQNPNFWKLKFSLSKQSDLDWQAALTINIFALTPSHHILPHVNGQ